MENRKFVEKLSIFLFLIGFGFFQPISVLAYGIETHAYLTDEVVDFYNEHFPSLSVPNELRPYLIEGSRHEDSAPRWCNHFYDPVYKRGLDDPTRSLLVVSDFGVGPTFNKLCDGIGGFREPSKTWATNEELQQLTSYTPGNIFAMLISREQEEKIKKFFPTSNLTWQMAIRHWLNSEKEMAMFTLGHVLHLIEDASVPDHTRNDGHPEQLGDPSPYEQFTGGYILTTKDPELEERLDGKFPTGFNNLADFFEGMASYSNSNFYSKDTIGVGVGTNGSYELPDITLLRDFFKKEGDVTYCLAQDKEFGDYRLCQVIAVDRFGYLLTSKDNLTLVDEENKILTDYWNLLSTKAVQYSAGVINLFFREVERAKTDPSFLEEEPKSFVANAFDAVRNFFTSTASVVKNAVGDIATFTQNIVSKIQNKPENIEEIVAESVEQIEQILAGDPTDGVVIDTDEERAQIRELQNQLDDITDQISDLAYQADVATGMEGRGGAQEKTDGADNAMDDADDVDDADASSGKDVNISSKKNKNNSNTIGGGASSGGGVAASAPNLVITEIMYNASGTDDGREWIEIRNDGPSVATLDDVRFLEGGTNHRLTFVQGNASLASGAYAVIADNAAQFLSNHPIFSGNLFDSSFSLLNDGETLALTWSGSTFHSVTYSSSTGASGDGNSLQLINGAWQANVPTPGAANVATSSGVSDSSTDPSATSTATSSPPTSGFGAYHVVISEVQVSGVDAGDEFIELYNPTDAAVDMSGWSLQYAGAGAEITSSTMKDRKKNFLATSSITAKSFFLVGRGLHSETGTDGYRGSTVPDMTYRSGISLSGASAGAKLFLVASTTPIGSESDTIILDAFDYTSTTVPEAGASLERRAWSNNLCHSVIPGGSGEFLGNACDTGVFADDFELRATSNPQNSGSFVEPRAAPTAPQPLSGASSTAAYSSSSVAINFAWRASSDFRGSTSTARYVVTNASTSATLTETTSTVFSWPIYEVGRSYSFILQAFDRDGMGSATSSVTVEVPSFVNSLHFYPDPFATSSRYAVDLYYDSYPFIPHRWSSGNSSRVAVFYLNRSPSTERDFVTHNISGGVTIPADMQSGLLAMKFRDCGGQQDQISLLPILPDSSGNCATAGPYVDDVAFSLLEDPHLRFILASSSSELALTESDYLTVAFYDYSSPTWACVCRMFSLVAVDANRYYFSTSSPPFVSPELPDVLQVEFDASSSRLVTRWAISTDADTLDTLITYDINFSTSSAIDEMRWVSAGPQPHADLDDQTFISHRFLRHVTPDDSFTIGVRAKDEFNVTSTARTVAWQYPATALAFTQSTSTEWSNQWGTKNPNFSTHPSTASLQSITPTTTLAFDIAAVRVWEDQVNRNVIATLRLSVFLDDGSNKPLLTSKLGEAAVDQLGNIATSTDLAFTFFSPLTLATSTKYWFALDVGSYSDNAAYLNNAWRSAIATGDRYPAGQAGIGYADVCTTDPSQCGTTIPSPSADADWYLKLYVRTP